LKSVYLDTIEIKQVPIENFQNNFDIYIYTPVIKEWDCSSRLIVECKFFGKEIKYYDINYCDKALKYRKIDLNNLNNLDLEKDDTIVQIIDNIINKKGK